MNIRLKNLRRQIYAAGCGVILAIVSTVLLFGTTFQLDQITPSDIQKKTWSSPSVTWVLNPTNSIVYSGSSTLASAAALQTLLTNAFTTWSGAQYQSMNVNDLSFTNTGSSTTNPVFNGSDCVNTIGFTQNLGSGIIGETQISTVATTTPGQPVGLYACTPGPNGTCPNEVCIVDADIEFNTSFNFYTSSYSSPPASYYDLQTVATHEIGHMVGLDHSGLANAVMFPFGDTGKGGIIHTLSIDDMIGIATLYPNGASGIAALQGGITGAVTVGGSASFAAHVVAIDSSTGNVITDTLTDPSGNYQLRMFQGSYYVLALPLATSTSTGVTTINNYTGFAAGYPSAPAASTNFTGAYY